MDLEFYNEEQHDYFLEAYRNYSRSPTEDEKDFFRPLMNELVEEISEVTGISQDFKLYFAATDEEELAEDLPINRYVHGFSFPEIIEGFDRDVIMLRAVNDRENWRACMINMLAHEIGHQEYYRKTGNMPYKVWENILFEGHAMNTAEKAAEKLGVDWKPHYRSDENLDIDSSMILERLDEDRTKEPTDIFVNGERPCANAEGYNLSYQIVKNILENEKLTLNELLERPEEKLRDLISTNVSESLQ